MVLAGRQYEYGAPMKVGGYPQLLGHGELSFDIRFSMAPPLYAVPAR